MPTKVTKTWVVNSGRNARTTHAAMDGETVSMDQTFSNGMMYPGDSGDAAEVANCNCTIAIEGTVKARPYNPAVRSQLESFEYRQLDKVGVDSANRVYWGELENPSTGKIDDIVIKYENAEDTLANEAVVQQLNDYYGFGARIPVSIERDGKLLSMRAEAKPLAKQFQIHSYDEALRVVQAASLEERQSIALLDMVTGNIDRHWGNLLVDDEGLVAIDHGLSMAFSTEFGDLSSYNIVMDTLRLQDMNLTSAMRSTLQSMLDDEAAIRARWAAYAADGRIEVEQIDAMFLRVRAMLQEDSLAWTQDTIEALQSRVTTSEVPSWANPALDDALRNNEVLVGEGVGDPGANRAWLGEVVDDPPINVVIKEQQREVAQAMIPRELLAQYMNDTYDFAVKMPRVAFRDDVLDSGNAVVSAFIEDARSGAQVVWEDHIDKYTLLEDATKINHEDLANIGFFDTVTLNSDRNMGNFLIDSEGNLFAIDHGLCFDSEAASSTFGAALGREGRVLTARQVNVLENILNDEAEIRAYAHSLPHAEDWTHVYDGLRLQGRTLDETLDEMFDVIRDIKERGRW